MRVAYDGCPLCGGEGSAFRSEACEPRGRVNISRLEWMKCGKCEHVYTSHYFSKEGHAQLLSQVMQDGFFGGNLDVQRKLWSRVIDRLLPHVAREGKWIDVGVGNGSFLFTAAEYGFDAVGIDTRHYILDALREYGYNVEHADAMEYDYTGASVVVLADILEHMPYPKALLQRIREKLVGPLFVSCPNMDSVSWKYLERAGDSPYWKELEHYHNFTRARLQSLLMECGFTPVHYGISPRYTACMEIIAT
jgi:2-polyprenyl-3-methyl-5-hydroxy-6-metoxy-1,4-benzoquinol methylase